ncbi:DUF4231 domain-containing protein [Mycoplasma marinum]|uniref:DUF4231 domain-containing protein n=1 Tax=Mycoplasma marinum TaxID=1937190 RepID=A0A4R0XW78_9MOLU|nr:DUF4231 domain-containing protein [Mycoplasma marinum]TCG11221.1 hypothetical protein C4B24_02570 [Mycoplasma marinum]
MNKQKIIDVLKKDEGILGVWNLFNNKYRKSKINFTIINGTIFILTALLVLLNLWAMLTLKNPPYSGIEWQWARNCFLSMAIITAITGFLTAMLSLFKFKSVSRQAKEAVKIVKEEFKEYKSANGKYAKINNKDQVFIEFVTEAVFIED